MSWQSCKNAPGVGVAGSLSGAAGLEYRRLEQVAIGRDEMRGRSGQTAARYTQRGQAIIAASMSSVAIVVYRMPLTAKPFP